MINVIEETRKEIKSICEAIEKVFNEGKTPQEIAKMFGAKREYINDDDCEYDYYNIDFEHFGITFVRFKDTPDNWWWQNDDEIWSFDDKEWYYWKRF